MNPNPIAAAEERIVSERLRRKLNEVNVAAQNHLSEIQDHVNFTLQQAYFKCAYECFDRRRNQEGISNCVENCSVPVVSANTVVENEMAKFQGTNFPIDLYPFGAPTSDYDVLFAQERMNRSLMVCQDKFEAAKLKQIKTGAMADMESCVDQAIQDSIQMLPHIVHQLKASLSINNYNGK